MCQSLISKAVPVSEVPLAGWRWEMLQWGSPRGAVTRTQNSRAMSPSSLSTVAEVFVGVDRGDALLLFSDPCFLMAIAALFPCCIFFFFLPFAES